MSRCCCGAWLAVVGGNGHVCGILYPFPFSSPYPSPYPSLYPFLYPHELSPSLSLHGLSLVLSPLGRDGDADADADDGHAGSTTSRGHQPGTDRDNTPYSLARRLLVPGPEAGLGEGAGAGAGGQSSECAVYAPFGVVVPVVGVDADIFRGGGGYEDEEDGYVYNSLRWPPHHQPRGTRTRSVIRARRDRRLSYTEADRSAARGAADPADSGWEEGCFCGEFGSSH